jgi:hypothetical protein
MRGKRREGVDVGMEEGECKWWERGRRKGIEVERTCGRRKRELRGAAPCIGSRELRSLPQPQP